MIDIHAHILPGLDDGAATVQEALDMIVMAYDSGVAGITAVVHGDCAFERMDEYKQCIKKLRYILKEMDIPAALYSGMEICMEEGTIERLRQGKLLTMNQTRYVLIEFAFDENIRFVFDSVYRLQKEGYKVIIAHPERYYFFQEEPHLIYDFVRKECVMQVNKGSILGEFGRNEQRLSYQILASNLAGAVASDAHGTRFRNSSMAEVKNILCREFSNAYAELLLMENPVRILRDQDVL